MLISGEFQNIFLDIINYGKKCSSRWHIALDQLKMKGEAVIYRVPALDTVQSSSTARPPPSPSLPGCKEIYILPCFSLYADSFKPAWKAGRNEGRPRNRHSVQDLGIKLWFLFLLFSLLPLQWPHLWKAHNSSIHTGTRSHKLCFKCIILGKIFFKICPHWCTIHTLHTYCAFF